MLPESLGVDPSGIAPASLTPLPSRTFGSKRNVPLPLTTFVGRRRELAAAAALLVRDDIRLLTLIGPGGVGKTRLALAVAVARTVAADFTSGVIFVPLAPIHDPDLVAPTIAQALGVQEVGGRPLIEGLGASLRDRRLLLVLDNFEQVVTASGMLATLLAVCPFLTILVTSRTRLNISGEQLFPVPALAVPEINRGLSVDQIGETDAIRLFVERAQRVNPAFALTEGNAGNIAAICHQLEGLPLAIELAAVRTTHVSLVTMATRLEKRLPLLTGGARDLPDRHRTMRDAIAWSYDLLTEAEQTLFRRLAVFAGGFTLDAAAMVAGGGAADIDVLAGVSSLVDVSLLESASAWTGEIEPRFRMLETIREFGLEQLVASGEESAVRSRHGAYLLSLAEKAESALWGGPHLTEWRRRLEDELDNLRAALDWLIGTADAATALRLITATGRFWLLGGYLTERRSWLERAFIISDGAPAAVRAKALALLAVCEVFQQNKDYGPAHAAEALELAVAAGDQSTVAFARFCRAISALAERDFARAAAEATESAALFEALDQPAAANNARFFLARAELGRGNEARGAAHLAEYQAVAEHLGDPDGAARAHGGLAVLARRRGDNTQALEHYQAALRLSRDLDEPWHIALYLEGIAAVTGAEAATAARLLGAADALRTRLGAPVPPEFRSGYDRAVEAIRTRLGDAFTEAWDAGRALEPEQAITDALAQSLAAPNASNVFEVAGSAAVATQFDLTRREL
ncbi:MAG TPA: NB-ARC domain-containing protein, partial [Thermomicrobiales bacterium]|nr:NB-ARC domain-containing protein [Thermomicrobiales bacterium]